MRVIVLMFHVLEAGHSFFTLEIANAYHLLTSTPIGVAMHTIAKQKKQFFNSKKIQSFGNTNRNPAMGYLLKERLEATGNGID